MPPGHTIWPCACCVKLPWTICGVQSDTANDCIVDFDLAGVCLHRVLGGTAALVANTATNTGGIYVLVDFHQICELRSQKTFNSYSLHDVVLYRPCNDNLFVTRVSKLCWEWDRSRQGVGCSFGCSLFMVQWSIQKPACPTPSDYVVQRIQHTNRPLRVTANIAKETIGDAWFAQSHTRSKHGQ